jgi:hypothetical protein
MFFLACSKIWMYACFMKNVDRKTNRSFPRGCLLGLVSILLGICLTAGSAFYQRRDYPVCQGGLSAGFPLVFLCDGSGGSPIGSQGKIDLADWFNGNPLAFLLDFLLYGALLSLAWLIVMGLIRKSLSSDENFRWGLALCILYIVTFLFAFMSFQSNSLNVEVPFPKTPTPYIFVPSPTPFGTLPPAIQSPVATTGP